MKRRTFHASHAIGRVNVTPMIDVVMVMIVFYLIVGKLVLDRRTELKLPVSVVGRDESAKDLCVVNVLRDGTATRVVLEGRQLKASMLAGVLAERLAERPGTVVQIRGSRDLSYGQIAPVIDAARSAGITSVRLSTEQKR
jgi:biopolymer transport protein ExbD